MYVTTVQIGQAVQLGDIGVVKVKERSGNSVKLGFAMPSVFPITLIPSGVIPPKFVTGVNGRPTLVPTDRQVAVAG